MKRTTGIYVMWIGIALVVVGLLGAIILLNQPMIAPVALTVFLILASVGVVAIPLGLWLRAAERPASSSRVGNYLADISEARFRDGIEFEVHYQTPISGKNGRPSMLVVRLPADTPATVQFNRLTWFDRLGKRLGIARQPPTGDAEFEEAIYVRGPSEEYAEAYLANPDTRAAIVTLVDIGFREVRLTGADIEAVWMNFDPAKHDRPKLPEDTAAVLSILAARLPVVPPGFAVGRDWTWTINVLLWTFCGLLGASTVFLFIYPTIHDWDLFPLALELFAWTYIGMAIVAALLLRGTLIAHDRWGRLVGFGWLLIGFGSFGTAAAMNGMGDPAPLALRVVPVVDKWTSSGRHGTTYYVAANAWDRPGERVNFKVSSSEYAQINPGRSRLQLLTGPGRYGIEWLKEQTVIP